MGKRPFRLANQQKKNKAAEEDHDTTTTDNDPTSWDSLNSRKMTILLLACLPLPFLFGVFMNKTQFFMQETKRKSMTTTDSTSFFYSNRTSHKTMDIRQSLVDGAIEFVQNRREAYMQDMGERVNQESWKIRGHGWLLTYQKMVLAARIVDSKGKPNQISMGDNKIQIFDVHPESHNRQNCDLLTLWVRLNGPEIISGKPKAIYQGDTCHWEFDFLITKPGSYHFDAKVLFWNGKAPVVWYKNEHPEPQMKFEPTQCKVLYEGNVLPDEQFQHAPQKTSLVGFKMYAVAMSCCEMCRRYTGCLYFATPPKIMPKPLMAQNGCELYYSKDTPSKLVPQSRVMDWAINHQKAILEREAAQAAADAKAQEEANRAAQAEADARAQEANRASQAEADTKAQEEANRAALEAANAAAAQQQRQQQTDPEQVVRRLVLSAMEQYEQQQLATTMNNTTYLRHRHRHRRRLQNIVRAWGSPYSDNPEVAYFLGCGWSFMFTLEQPCLSGELDDLVFTEQSDFEVTEEATPSKKDGSNPLPLCTLYDESLVPNVTDGVGRWVREAWPDDCLPYQDVQRPRGWVTAHDPERPHCWWRTDLRPLNKQCVEMNCGIIETFSKWNSTSLQHEQQFNAVWRNYHCDYLEFTDAQLNQCFQTKKIKEINVKGASIGSQLTDYLNARTEKVAFYDSNAPDGKVVVLSSVTWPHLLWRGSEDSWRKELNKIPAEEEAYWVSPMFTSSEREPYVQIERGLQLLEVAEPILKSKGYHVINLFDPTAAMTYDTSAQMDGLHILGPPMKYAVTRALHHMCSGVVDGTRV